MAQLVLYTDAASMDLNSNPYNEPQLSSREKIEMKS